MPALADYARERLAELAAGHQLRTPVDSAAGEGATLRRNGRLLLNFSGNDYFGLARHPEVVRAAREALEQHGAGGCGSRLVVGNHPLYTELETALAAHHAQEAACVFGSGYLASLAVGALAGKGDLVLADRLTHASLLDGIQLSGAKLLRFRHNDQTHAEELLQAHRHRYRHCLIVTETVFSMDGDLAPIPALSALAKAHDSWLLADDAHGIGLTEYRGMLDIHMGTLSKGLGGLGGYWCGGRDAIALVKSKARSLIYTTALPPASLASALAALKVLQCEPGRPAVALARARQFTAALGLPEAQSCIVPVILGEESTALSAMRTLEEQGFLLSAIRPPTVPAGTSRLRATFTHAHRAEDVTRLAECLKPLRETP